MGFVPSALPDGDAAPPDGALPAPALAEVGSRPLGLYVHVPFCTVRCGYCDFNTYTAAELGEAPGASRTTYADAAIQEIRLARRVLGDVDVPVSTVFFGGGTPTVLPAPDLVRMLDAIRGEFGLTADVEVTTEANPDSVTPAGLTALREGGFNRVSLGMQSAVPSVLAVLDRTHDPARVPQAVGWARAAGFAEVSLDVIYGTPGESLADWRTTLDAVTTLDPGHVSAYALIVEPGTALQRRIGRGELPMPDDDDLADKYELADAFLSEAGFEWYEVSNWRRGDAAPCRHNLGYWHGHDWWGVGPGAHSHVGGVRWWNVKHPAAYGARLAHGLSPAAAREVLDDETRRVERVMLQTRLATGLPVRLLDARGRKAVPELEADGLVVRTETTTDGADLRSAGAATTPDAAVVLSARGRLLADAVVRSLLP